jgi:hypothetical protein
MRRADAAAAFTRIRPPKRKNVDGHAHVATFARRDSENVPSMVAKGICHDDDGAIESHINAGPPAADAVVAFAHALET